jgi:hypothetical protein
MFWFTAAAIAAAKAGEKAGGPGNSSYPRASVIGGDGG